MVGIFADVPDNSHLQFDVLVSTKIWEAEDRRNSWGANDLNTYLLLANNADTEKLEVKFHDFLIKHMGEETLEYYSLFLQPLSDVHLGSIEITHNENNHKKFARSSVNIFLIFSSY
ncbi:MAG: putative ABC transport system permease protein [Candidatus Endobugula sp.]